MTRAIIIEDEASSLQNLINQLKKYCPQIEVVATGQSNADLLRLSQELAGKFDLAFLDIQLLDGLVFQGLKQLDEIPFDIIFVTAFDQYALRAFDFSAIDYVLKPIDGDDLSRAVSRVRASKKSPPQTKARLEIMQQNYPPAGGSSGGGGANVFEKIGISGMENIHFVRLSDIVRLEGADNYTHFILADGEKVTASKSIGHYEDLLKHINFVRVHKKNVVNMNHMKTYIKGDGGYLLLDNKERVEVSRRKKPALMEALRRNYGHDL